MNRNLRYALAWGTGGAVLGFGLYQLWKILKSPRAKIDLEPAENPPEAHPYYDPKHHRAPEPVRTHSYVSDHRPQHGNLPGERNQIGGRASGKAPRYK